MGKYIVRRYGGREITGRIVETEAYDGPHDLASHASRGKTERNAAMFGPAGFAYVYMIYGIYYCFNIVTGKKDYPAAVLIRAVEPVPLPVIQSKKKETNGPGKFSRVFRIDKKLNHLDLASPRPDRLWLEDRGEAVKKSEIAAAKRIGVDYAQEYKDRPWRFYLKRNEWVSNLCGRQEKL